MKGSLGFNPGKPLGSMDVNAAETPKPQDVESSRREKLIKAGQRVCANCKFSRQVTVGELECHKNAAESHDRVTGEPITIGWVPCTTQRAEELDYYLDYCGIVGRWFEQKEPK